MFRQPRATSRREAAHLAVSHARYHERQDLREVLGVPLIEVHLSNIHQREEFRHRSYFSDIAEGVIVGLGAQGYELALCAALSILQNREG